MSEVPAAAGETPTFETALATLQQITSRLEEGRDGLETSLAEFERGVKLLRLCYLLLENAEQKIEQLVAFNEAGEAVLAPFDASATGGQPAGKRRAPRKKPAAELEFDDE